MLTAAKFELISAEKALSIAAFPIGYYSASKGLGQISMHDAVMAYMYKYYPKDKKRYEIDDISESIKKTTGVDFSNFLNKYVADVQAIPIANDLHLSDALWRYTFNTQNKLKYKYLYQTLGIKSIE